AATFEMAQKFLLGIAEHLGVDPGNVLPAYEDAFHYLHKERQLPDNVTPEQNKLKDPEERARVAQIFERGLDTPTGYVLPIQRWKLRQQRLFRPPADSPVGLRLPLEALPWLAPGEFPQVIVADPSVPTRPLPDVQRRLPPGPRPDAPQRGEQDAKPIRTAISV